METQIFNLENNYKQHAGQVTHLLDEGEYKVEYHHRNFGRGAYYLTHKGRPVAYCVGHEVKRNTSQRFMITSTFVHPDYRKQGNGRKLYEAIIDSGVLLVSDWDQTEGAIALWKGLLRDLPLRTVAIVGDRYIAKKRN